MSIIKHICGKQNVVKLPTAKLALTTETLKAQLLRIEIFSLRGRRLEVVGARKSGRVRGRHARGEGAPARKAHENRFSSHSVSADISQAWIFPIGWESPEGKSNRAGRENCHSIAHGQRSEGLILHHQLRRPLNGIIEAQGCFPLYRTYRHIRLRSFAVPCG